MNALKSNPIIQKIADNNILRMALGAVIGAVLGYLYWKLVGCNSGGCPITASPYRTTIIFSLLGLVFARKEKKK